MTAPAFIYTSEPWAALSLGRPIFRPTAHLPQSSSALRFTAGRFGFLLLIDVLVSGRSLVASAPCAIIMEHSGGALLSDRCGLFATLGECFCPTTLLGDFPVRMSQ
jgi:hypothetical protein